MFLPIWNKFLLFRCALSKMFRWRFLFSIFTNSLIVTMYRKSTEWFTRWKNRIFCCLKSHNEANDIFLYAMQVALINYDDVIKVIILNAIIVCILHFYCIRFYFYTHITVLSTKSNFNCANNLKQKAIIFQLRYHGSPWSAWHAPE